MLTRNNFGSFLAFFLWVVMAMPGVIDAQQPAGPKADPPRAGINGVTSPQCIYCPQPDYSQKVRKAKIEGVVLLDVTVTTDGQIANPVVLKGPDVGLNNKALEAVRNWKMKPARGPDGQPVNCRVQVEIAFHLYPNAT
jgi:periplasmic protein TonB